MENLMKKILAIFALALFASTAHANFFGSNDGEWKMGPNGPYWDESDWPEWTPMYWMEAFMNSWDDDDNNGFGGSYYPSMTMNNRVPYMQGNYPYPSAPYGYPAPATPTAPVVSPIAPPAEATPK